MWGDHVAKKKIGHASWFKLYLNHGPVLNAVSDEDAGRAIKAALRYLETGQPPSEIESAPGIVFAALKPSIDEAIDDYRRKSEGGKAGNNKRWGKEVSDGIGVRYPAIPSDRMVSDGIEKIEDRRYTESSGYYAGNFPEDAEDLC